MIEGKKVLGLVPARGDSKRLPRKNVLDLAGKPLIAWTIDAGLSCKYIDTLMVSSDDEEIMALSESRGANVPFKRPDHLASDTAASIDAVMHALDFYRERGVSFDFVVLLQPTSPLRTGMHINSALELLIDKKAYAVISVCKTAHSPLWCNTLGEDLSMDEFLNSDVINKRSQDLPDFYRLNGAIYIADVAKLEQDKTFFLSNNTIAYKMDELSSVDIDTEIDLCVAEALMMSQRGS